MKKTIWITTGCLLLVIAVWAIMYTYPKHHTFTIEGVMYQLGEENKDFVEPVLLTINGKLKKSLSGVRKFTGIIEIKDEYIPVPKENRQLELTFNNDGESQISYRYLENGEFQYFLYGIIFINDDFSKITIAKYTKGSSNNWSWNGGDGYMISVPAQNRDEALEISNELMQSYLKGFTLQ